MILWQLIDAPPLRGGGHSFLYIAYMCAQDLFIRGLFTLMKNLLGMVFFKMNVNVCILIHPINKFNHWGSFEKIILIFYFLFSLFLLVLHSFLIPQVTNFLTLPQFCFS